MNSGVMLFRKGRWAQEFLEDVAKLGRIPEPKLQKVFHLSHPCSLLFHQSAVVAL